jgi:hypothetical protein
MKAGLDRHELAVLQPALLETESARHRVEEVGLVRDPDDVGALRALRGNPHFRAGVIL